MKLSYLAILFALLIVLSCVADARRVRRHTKTKGILEEMANFGYGFLSGVSGVDGEGINKCLPESWTSQAVKQDSDDTLPGEITPNDFGCLKYIVYAAKIVLDVACIFKDSLLKAFGYSVRRRRFRRRIFLQAKLKNKLGTLWPDWIKSIVKGVKSAWNWMTEKYNKLKQWVNDKWGNFKVWARKKWEAIKDWTQEQWDKLTNFCKEAVEKAKTIYNTVVNYVTTVIVPIIQQIISCGTLIYKFISNLINVVRAVLAIVSGNVVEWAIMIVNLICNYSELWKAVQIGMAIFEKAGQRWFYTGKLIGHILNVFGNTVSAKPEVEEKTAIKKSPSFLDKIKSIKEWLSKGYEVYNTVFENIETVGDKHTTNRTKADDRGEGKVQYLDRHEIDCGQDKVVSYFKLERPSFDSVYYQYSCNAIRTPGKQTEYATAWDVYEDDKGTNFLDRHKVKCPHGEALSKIHAEVGPSDKLLRYSYVCTTARLCDCKNLTTKLIYGGRHEKFPLQYLDKHALGNETSMSAALTYFKLNVTPGGDFQYEYTLCDLC